MALVGINTIIICLNMLLLIYLICNTLITMHCMFCTIALPLFAIIILFTKDLISNKNLY